MLDQQHICINRAYHWCMIQLFSAMRIFKIFSVCISQRWEVLIHAVNGLLWNDSIINFTIYFSNVVLLVMLFTYSTTKVHKPNFNITNLSLISNIKYYFHPPGYESFMQSDAIHVDFTPPDPGHLIETEEDILIHEDCYHYTPSHLSHRCIDQTPIHNYR